MAAKIAKEITAFEFKVNKTSVGKVESPINSLLSSRVSTHFDDDVKLPLYTLLS